MPHVTPTGWSCNPDLDTIDVAGMNLARTKKYRDIRRTSRAALVIDDVLPPWRPRGVEIRGHADAIRDPEAAIRIHPERIISWGLEDPDAGPGRRRARDVGPTRRSSNTAVRQPESGSG
jgi:pyridoxamine 5'-phosphate oxidase family protein